MSKMAQVLNESKEEYVEEWNGKTYRIPGGQAVTMTRNEAVNFMGRYPGHYPNNYKDPELRGKRIPKCLTLVSVGDDFVPPSSEVSEQASKSAATESSDALVSELRAALLEKDKQIDRLDGQLNKLAGILEKSGVVEKALKK